MEYHYILLGILIVVAFYTDVTKSLLPNWLTMSGVAVGVLFHLIIGGLDGLFFSFIGLLFGGGLLMLLYLFKAIGAGDVKLFAAIGAIAGFHFTLYTLMYSIFFAGIIGAIILLFRKQFVSRMVYAIYRIVGSIMSRDIKSLEDFKRIESTRFPFMYAVLPGVIVTITTFL
jgi:prepilin peptidase CpaA